MTWRMLRHPNVLLLLGATMINNKFAMTSIWMKNGNINEFIEKNGDTDRFKLVRLRLLLVVSLVTHQLSSIAQGRH